MSRKGKLPIIPDNVTTTLENSVLTVKGPKGELTLSIRSDFSVESADSQLIVKIIQLDAMLTRCTVCFGHSLLIW